MDNHNNEKSIADESSNWRRRPVDANDDLKQQPSRSYNRNRNKSYQKPFLTMEDLKPIRKPKNKTITQPQQEQQEPKAIEPKDSKDKWKQYAKELAENESSGPTFNRRHLDAAPPAYKHPEDRNGSRRRTLFDPFMNPLDVEKGLEAGELYQGIMRLSNDKYDAYAKSDDLDHDIYIAGVRDRNRALDGDLVAVKLSDDIDHIWDVRNKRKQQQRGDRLQRRKEKNRLINGEEEGNDENPVLVQPEEDGEEEEGHKPKYCGKVVSIIERVPNATYSGFIMAEKPGGATSNNNNNNHNDNESHPRPLRTAWFKPVDKRVPIIVLKDYDIPRDLIDHEDYYKTHLFAAFIRRWQITDLSPTGGIAREIGPVGDLLAEKEAILADNSIVVRDFTPVALESIPKTPWSIPEKEYKSRRDLRFQRVFSIDPPTAKDLDDALHIKELDNGFYEVGVHIADVSYFVKHGTPLDSEAKERGTSTYLVDSVIPMLPSALCEDLCSLNPGVERLAFSVIWKMDKTGKPVDTWFGRTIIKSCAKLAYGDAQMVIDGDGLPSAVQIDGGYNKYAISNDIYMLYELSLQMRKRRYDAGSLSMSSTKLQFELNDQGEPISVFEFEAKAANRLIEEFMLLANISVAQKIVQAFPSEALLRRHEDPLERRLDKFMKITEALGLDFDVSTGGALQTSFDRLQNKIVKDVLMVIAIRTMQRAKYFCSGSLDISKFRHYALNELVYTHFTSPIRRYADVVVHRLLNAAIEQDKTDMRVSRCPYNKKMVQKMALDCNIKKDRAKNAQDSNILLYLSKYLTMVEERDGPVYTKADVVLVSKTVYEVYVPEYGLEKRIYLEELPVSRFEFDKTKLSLNIFWKRDIPVTMHNEEKIYAQQRVRKEGGDDDDDSDEDEDGPLDSLARLSLREPKEKTSNGDELIPPVILDEATCMQTISTFSSIDVRLQINNERSPPIINVYPVNPFCKHDESFKESKAYE